MQKLNICLARVTEIIAGLTYKGVCLMGIVSPYAQNAESKSGSMSAITFLLKVRVVIFCRALSQRTRLVCITMTWNCKAIHFNIITLLLPKRKNLSLSLVLENTCSQFYGTTDILFTRSTLYIVKVSE